MLCFVLRVCDHPSSPGEQVPVPPNVLASVWMTISEWSEGTAEFESEAFALLTCALSDGALQRTVADHIVFDSVCLRSVLEQYGWLSQGSSRVHDCLLHALPDTVMSRCHFGTMLAVKAGLAWSVLWFGLTLVATLCAQAVHTRMVDLRLREHQIRRQRK